MSDDNVRRFPRLGLVGPSESPPDPAADAPEQASAAPVPPLAEAPAAGRRSPLESIAAMASPGLSDPVVTTPESPAITPGHVPSTFRPAGFHEGGQVPQPGLGTLSLAAVLAVAVAAMRGIHGAITGVRANREQRRAAADLAASGRGDGTGRRGRVQSPAEFGRGFLGRQDRAGGWFRSGGGRGGGGGGRGGFGGFGGWGGGSSSRYSGSRRASGLGADAGGGRRNRGGGSGAGGGRSGGPGGSGGGSASGTGSGSGRSGRWWRGGSKQTSQRGTGVRQSKRGSANTGAGAAVGAGGASPAKGALGRTKSPKAGTAPKGTLRPNKKNKAVGAGGSAGGARLKTKRGAKGTSGAGKTSASAKKTGKNSGASPGGPVGLRQALGNEFERRWAKRRKQQPPVIGPLPKKARRKAAAKKRKKRGAATATGSGPKVNLNNAQQQKAKKPRKNQKPTGSPPPRPGTNRAGTPGPGGGGPSKHTGHGGGHWSRNQRRAQQRWEQRRAAHAGPDDDFWFVWGPNGMRRTPWQSAAAAGAQGETVIKVERVDQPGDQEARRRRPKVATAPPALPVAAPATGNERKETGSMSLPDRVMSGLVTGMSSEHATEVTLDDSLEVLERLTVESFAAHETSARLAEEARRNRHLLEELAADLRSRHNVIGRLTAAALERWAESMELLARKAEEMKISSLDAAELSEVAENDMFDAYKPVQQATADAGLQVPSARVHNEG